VHQLVASACTVIVVTMSTELVPGWARAWYLFNLVICPGDVLFIMMRPRSVKGGDLEWLFTPFNYYCTLDSLFCDESNKIVFYIYLLGLLDVLLNLYLLATFKANIRKPSFALLAVWDGVFVATKTAVYLMYSQDFLLPTAKILVTAMNSMWFFFPLLIAWGASNRMIRAVNDSLTSKKS